MLTGKRPAAGPREAFIWKKGTKEFYTQAAAKSGASAKKGFESLAEWRTGICCIFSPVSVPAR